MKKRIILLSSIILLLSIITIVVATQAYAYGEQKILNGRKISSPSELYEEVNLNARSTVNNSEICNVANSYIEKIAENVETFKTENAQIKTYSNAMESRLETKISNDETIVTLNSNNNELISYVSQKTQFPDNTCTEEQIREKAIAIFNNVDIENASDYELTKIEEFDEEIWRAEFYKKYNGVICKGESVKFSFAPESNEVVTMAINRITYANNETLISEQEATTIAQEYLNESSATEMKMTKEIVRPNYFYRELEGDTNLYSNINQCRNAYIFTFNNEAESQVYIDCTTGEVIGGNMALGGEY